MKPYQIFLLLIVGILVAVLVPFYLLTKDNLHYEYIGGLRYMWDREDNLIENMASREEEVKAETVFLHMSWYKGLKGKIAEGKWENKETEEGERFIKKDHSGMYYYDERGNNGYATTFEKGEFTYIALTPGVSPTMINELKVNRIYEKENRIIFDLKTISGVDTSIDYRVLFIKMKTSDLKGKELVVRRNVESSMGRTFIDELISSF